MELLLVLLTVVLLAVFWVYQFAFLMSLDKDVLPPEDKILWSIGFILLFFLTPFAFVLWKKWRTLRDEKR